MSYHYTNIYDIRTNFVPLIIGGGGGGGGVSLQMTQHTYINNNFA